MLYFSHSLTVFVTLYFHDYIPINYKYFNYLLDVLITFLFVAEIIPHTFLSFRKIPNLSKHDASNKRKGQSKKITTLLSYSVLLPERFFLEN